MFSSNINSEKLDSLPKVSFDGDIIVIDKLEKVHEACEYLSGFDVIGFDTETRPCFSKGKRHKVSLLQLATDKRAYLFRLAYTGITNELKKLLESEDIIKVGAAIRDDIKALKRLSRFEAKGFIDLQNIAGNYGILELGVRKMAALVLDIRISKSQQLSNWDRIELTTSQTQYAATDAWVCREIFLRLSSLKL